MVRSLLTLFFSQGSSLGKGYFARQRVLLTNSIVKRVSPLSALRHHLHRRQCRALRACRHLQRVSYGRFSCTLQRELYQPAGISLRLIFREYKVSGERENARESDCVETKSYSRIFVIMQTYARASVRPTWRATRTIKSILSQHFRSELFCACDNDMVGYRTRPLA